MAKKPKLCCLVNPDWKCSVCGFSTCRECWSNDYPNINLHTLNTHPGKEFCDKCVPKDADYGVNKDHKGISHWAYGAPTFIGNMNIQGVTNFSPFGVSKINIE